MECHPPDDMDSLCFFFSLCFPLFIPAFTPSVKPERCIYLSVVPLLACVLTWCCDPVVTRFTWLLASSWRARCSSSPLPLSLAVPSSHPRSQRLHAGWAQVWWRDMYPDGIPVWQQTRLPRYEWWDQLWWVNVWARSRRVSTRSAAASSAVKVRGVSSKVQCVKF